MRILATLLAPVQRWRAMHELRALERQETQGHSWDFKNLLFEANELLERDFRGRAKEIWKQAYARFPDAAMTSEPALELLLRLELYADAEAILKRAFKRYPRRVEIVEGLALVASKRGDHAEAARRCEVLREKYPQSLKGYWIGAGSLSQLGRVAEAEATLARGLRVAPDNLVLRIEYARLPDRSGDWTEALSRWRYVHETLGHLAGTVGMVNNLARLERFDEADRLVDSVRYRCGNDVGIWIASAQVAEQKKDWEEAANRWEAFRKRFPLSSIGYVGAVRSLDHIARSHEAEEILQEGMARIGDDAKLFVEYARIAQHRREWTNAATRWAMVRERFPSCKEAYVSEALALDALDRPAEAASIRAMSPGPSA